MPVERWPPTPKTPTHLEQGLLARGLRMERQLRESSVTMFPGTEFASFDDFCFNSYPLPTDLLNQVLVLDRPKDPPSMIEQAKGYFEHRSPRWRIVARAGWGAFMDPSCRVAGLSAHRRDPVMVLRAEELPPNPQIARFECRRIETWEDLQEFNSTFARTNELPEVPFWLNRDLIDLPNFHMYAGFHDDKPVATGVGFVAHRITGVWGIATLPKFRGKGYGTAITGEVLHAGIRSGAQAAHLWATPMGYPMYLKMGFRHVDDRWIWQFERQIPRKSREHTALDASASRPRR